jgi:hypothetical protein
MPFVSEKQRRFLFANKPSVAREFAQAEKRKTLLTRKRRKTKLTRSKT